MLNIANMSLSEIEATIEQLRARRVELKTPHKAAERKIATLTNRRERLIAQVNAIDEEMTKLRGLPSKAADQPRIRRHAAKTTDTLAAILACVKQHGTVKRGMIMEHCNLSRGNAALSLRQLVDDGKLVRQGERSAATYSLA